MKSFSVSLLHTAWTEEESKLIDEAIAYVEKYNGTNYILDSCLYLYKVLKIDYILINVVEAVPEATVKSLLFLNKGIISKNIQYPLSGSPCEVVFGKELNYYPGGVQTLFPDNITLKEMQVISYLGIPISDNSEQGLGCLALLHSNIIERGGFVEALVNVLLPRLVEEMASINKSAKSHADFLKQMEEKFSLN